MRDEARKPVIVSACLLGLNTRYNGGNARSATVLGRLKGCPFIPVCPEQLGGFPTPRPKAAICSGSGALVLGGKARVMDESGADVTERFIKGAEEVMKVARMCGATVALLKDKSPSCGVKRIYNGTELVSGEGVTTALLRKNGIEPTGF